jgi:hypothetical protein
MWSLNTDWINVGEDGVERQTLACNEPLGSTKCLTCQYHSLPCKEASSFIGQSYKALILSKKKKAHKIIISCITFILEIWWYPIKSGDATKPIYASRKGKTEGDIYSVRLDINKKSKNRLIVLDVGKCAECICGYKSLTKLSSYQVQCTYMSQPMNRTCIPWCGTVRDKGWTDVLEERITAIEN